eukprot:TRINITY_DN11803_c0_g1_i1.p1 TRINITY_DN11803_c0_g1~~TRINITY_DN11803_c0_g1_i1.p1  ORF type:complete len:367 (+),score=44.34 TRINITY_DN11803_c0_g1_i1:90-1190(+)
MFLSTALVRQTTLILSWISCVLVLFPIATFLRFESKRKFPARLSLFFCLSAFALCLSIGIGFLSPSLCFIQAIGIQFWANVCVMWWCCVSVNYYLYVVGDFCNERAGRFEKIYHVVAWGVPGILVGVALGMDLLQKNASDDSWECWLDRGSSWIFPYLLLDLELVCVTLIGLYVWLQSLRRLWTLQNMVSQYQYQTAPAQAPIGYFRHLTCITGFVCMMVVLVSYRVVSDISSDPVPLFLELFHGVALAGLGIYSFIVFGLSEQNFSLWKSVLFPSPPTPIHHDSSSSSSPPTSPAYVAINSPPSRFGRSQAELEEDLQAGRVHEQQETTESGQDFSHPSQILVPVYSPSRIYYQKYNLHPDQSVA